MKRYADRGTNVLREPEYMAHVQAMTAEGLHSKADIAAELAYRDIEIRNLRHDLARCMARELVSLNPSQSDRRPEPGHDEDGNKLVPGDTGYEGPER